MIEYHALPLGFAKKLVRGLESSGRKGKHRNWKRTGITLTPEDVQNIYAGQSGRCYWSGLPLIIQYNKVPYHPFAISIDRLCCELDGGKYAANNVVLCRRMFNLGRNQYPDNGFKLVMEELVKEIIRNANIKESCGILNTSNGSELM